MRLKHQFSILELFLGNYVTLKTENAVIKYTLFKISVIFNNITILLYSLFTVNQINAVKCW